MSKDLRQTVNFNCTPKEFFQFMTQSALQARIIGKPVNINRREGSKFRSYGRWVEGYILELKENKEIIQAWRANEWPKGQYSIVHMKITRTAGNKTKVTLVHQGVPAKFYNKIKNGWSEAYWNPFKAYLKEQKAQGRVTQRRAA